MAFKEVKKYHLGWRCSDHKGIINLFYAGQGSTTIDRLEFEDFTVMVDLLRNESPIHFDEATQVIATHHEPVGEGES